MKKITLGKIEKVELRDIWETEDKDFTPWLAKEESISQLGDTIGIELEVESQEKNVGPFRADILARDIATNHYVLIENQLEVTDHKHFGQIMTYAAGLDAFSIIWIAKQFTDEHRAAIDWINRITDENINFFGIEIEAIKIGESLAAPAFKVVAKPNDWTRSIKKAAADNKLSDTKLNQREYWTALKKYIIENGTPFKMQKPSPQHWNLVSIGKSGFQLALKIDSQKKRIAVAFEINTNNKEENKKYFDKLIEHNLRDSEIEISNSIKWNRLDNKKMSVISLSEEYDFLDLNTQGKQFEWFLETTSKFIKFFKPRIKNL